MATPERPALDSLNNYLPAGNGCWVWQGYIDRNGYGRVYDSTAAQGKRTDWVHRVSYRHYKGPIPERYEIDHTCENTACMNPDHLDVVTKSEHVRRTLDRLGTTDRQKLAAQLRHTGLTYGEIAEALRYASRTGAHDAVQAAIDKGLVDADDVPPPPRLTPEEREDIRALYALGVPQTEIAVWYRLDSSQISRVCNGQSSGHRQRKQGVK
ncbi:HNH endonuclease [Nonomuraea sp. WAC 01424]|uniref:HNH endonuclease n=1 Tax=Nonomuraea sp. WAC 01424 TaxID=2203200 RepID=UPI00163D1815|nr:HNH endonuclease [Nonomuraea sp. WAC 01424]